MRTTCWCDANLNLRGTLIRVFLHNNRIRAWREWCSGEDPSRFARPECARSVTAGRHFKDDGQRARGIRRSGGKIFAPNRVAIHR